MKNDIDKMVIGTDPVNCLIVIAYCPSGDLNQALPIKMSPQEAIALASEMTRQASLLIQQQQLN